MKVSTRTIRVYEGKQTRVEVEGHTVSVAWTFRNPQNGEMAKAQGIMPLAVARELSLVLADAVALVGEVVNEPNIVAYDRDRDNPITEEHR